VEGTTLSLIDTLRSRRSPLLERWSRRILEVYPRDSAGFVRGEPDRFRNPMGHAIREGASRLLDGLLAGQSPVESRDALDLLIRIRAVQNLTPTQAVGFVFLLKQVVDEDIADRGMEPPDLRELRDIHDQIDRLALEAFEVYSACRQQIYEIRAGALRRQTAKLQEFVDRCYGSDAPASDSAGDENVNGGGSRA